MIPFEMVFYTFKKPPITSDLTYLTACLGQMYKPQKRFTR